MNISFSVSGEFLTATARDFVLTKDFDRAMEFLSESIVGFPVDYVVKVLQGKAKLTGRNNLMYEEQDDLTFQQKLSKIFAGTYKTDGRFYMPYAYVSNWGKNDITPIEHARVPAPRESEDDWEVHYEYRSWHYVDNLHTDVVVTLDSRVGKIEVVLFKQIEIPFWLKSAGLISHDAKQAVEKYLAEGNHLAERGHLQRYGASVTESSVVIPTTIKTQPVEQPEFDVDVTICKDYSLDLGWLSPDGIFYGCDYSGHGDLADGLCAKFYSRVVCANGSEALLEKRNWIKLLRTLDCPSSFFYFAREIEGRVTPKQRKAIMCWCEKHGQRVPHFLKD